MRIAVIVLAAFLLDLLLGDPHYSWHPACLIGNLIAFLEKRIRPHMSGSPPKERIGGGILVLAVIIISTLIPWVIMKACSLIHPYLAFAVEILFCYQLLAAKSLKDESMKVYQGLIKGDKEQARYAVSMIVGRDTSVLDEAGITRAAVETVAENTSDGVIAPLIFMAIGGAPFAFFYKAVNTMDSMIGYKNERYRYLGTVAAKLDDLLNFIPARISGLLMIMSAGILKYDMAGSCRIFVRDRYKHASPNSAHTEAACAGALGLRLAGDAWYFGELHRKPYIGDPVREIEAEDIKRANRLMYGTSILCLLLCLVIRILIIAII